MKRKDRSERKLDAEALIAKNPGVNRKILDENLKKAADAAALGKKRSSEEVALPYGGKRIRSDEKTRQTEGVNLTFRQHYGNV